MAVFNLTFATTRAVIRVLRQALVGDPLFQPDSTGPARSGESMVLDAWGYQVRDFPVVVATGVPGANRRMDFADRVRPFYGIPLVEEAGGTQSLRTFDIPIALAVGEPIDVRYTGSNAVDLNAPSPYELVVQQKIVGSNPVNFVELTGVNIGPEATFPLKDFEASAKTHPTGQVFGGWYDLNVSLVASSRSTQSRELIADRIWSIIWFLKKRELRKLGVVVLDVKHVGYAQIDYGADKIYQSKFNVSVATEFEAIVQFAETVTDISVIGTAVSVTP